MQSRSEFDANSTPKGCDAGLFDGAALLTFRRRLGSNAHSLPSHTCQSAVLHCRQPCVHRIHPAHGPDTFCTPAQAKLQAVAEIAGDSAASSSAAAAALQIARSTPYVITAIVGHKNPRHVSDNLRVLGAQLLDRQMFREIMSDL